VDILRSIRRAVLVVGKLFRHHEEVEGAARVGETLRVLERRGEENACVKMAPFEILDACERVLIPYLRTPMGRAIAARLVCVEMESLRAFRCGRGRGAFWLSPRMVPARFVTAVVAFGCSSKMKEILADYAHACVKAMVRRDGRVSSASARDAAATFTKDVNDMLAIFTPQGEDEFVSSMLVRESENTRIDEYQSVFQLADQCQIHLRARAWLMSYALGRRDDLDRVRLRDLHRAFARDDEMIGEYLFWIATTHLDDTDRIIDTLRVVYEEIDLDLGAHLCEEILDDAIDGSWFALYLHEIADVVRAIERGRLKIRVRALEAERALERVQVMQGLMLKMMVACAACNVGVVLYVSGMLLQAKGVFGVAGLFAMQALVAQMKLGKLIKKEAQYAGAA